MGAYSFKNNKMYSRTGPASLYATPTRGKGPNKQYEHYGYGYDYTTMYDASAYAQDYSLYNAYYQAGYGYDYSNYGASGKTADGQTTAQPHTYTANQRGYDTTATQMANYPAQLTETSTTGSRGTAVDNRTNSNQYLQHYSGQSWTYPENNTTTQNRSYPGYNPSATYNSQTQYSQAGYNSF